MRWNPLLCWPMVLRHGQAALPCVLAVLSGCATGERPSLPKVPDLPSVPAVVKVQPVTKESAVTDRVGQAAITPLSDLNVVQQDIPVALLKAQADGPYRQPEPRDCPTVMTEIEALDDALGADFDDEAGSKKPSLLERGTGLAENYGVGVVRRTVEGLVPFRSWVRKLSGAEKHSKAVAAAITAGGVRRAYLKGHRDALACPRPPAQGVPRSATPAPAAASAPWPASAASAP